MKPEHEADKAMVERLQAIECPLGMLKQKYPELYEKLKTYENNLQYWSIDRCLDTSVFGKEQAIIYRLSPSFVLPEPVKVEPKFVEYAVYNDRGVWKCEVLHRKEQLALGKLSCIVGFAGVKFKEGGRTWHMNTVALIDEHGAFTDYENVNGDRTKPATPIAARFLIGGDK